jgi:glycosyltransferase involved in cell wall biosynthesis
MKKIVLFGPGPKFKGGISDYNTSLAKAFENLGNIEVHIVSWSQQYPSIIPRDFIDRKSKTHQLEGSSIHIHYITNYNDPFTWKQTYRLIQKINPEMVIFQWAIAVQGLPIGYIALKIKKHTAIQVIFDLHFVIQKEGSALDDLLTRIGIKNADSYIVHSYKTASELQAFFPGMQFRIRGKENNTPFGSHGKTILKLFHPVYKMFEPDPCFDLEKQKQEWNLKEHVFLFFGFIRKYKGLHNVIRAFAKVADKREDVSLLIVGESFWQSLDSTKFSTKAKNLVFGLLKAALLNKKDDERSYNPLALIDELGIRPLVACFNDYVPNEDVHKYFQVSDNIVLFYLTATPSGVESIAYNFKLPILATNIGHFPETVIDGYNGYLAEADNVDSMAQVMLKAVEHPIPKEHVAEAAKNMSWENYARSILNV